MSKVAAAGITNQTMLLLCLKFFNGFWWCSGTKFITIIYKCYGALSPACTQTHLLPSPLILYRLPTHSPTSSCTVMLVHVPHCLWPIFPLLDPWKTPVSMLSSRLMILYIILLSSVSKLAYFLFSFLHKIRNNMRVAIMSIWCLALFPGPCTVLGEL